MNAKTTAAPVVVIEKVQRAGVDYWVAEGSADTHRADWTASYKGREYFGTIYRTWRRDWNPRTFVDTVIRLKPLPRTATDGSQRAATARTVSNSVVRDFVERAFKAAVRQWAEDAEKVANVKPATGEVRRDNVEFHAGREAFAKGEPRHCPYLSGGTRAARWTLGWDEAQAESKVVERDGQDVEDDGGIVETGGVKTIDLTPTWAGILPGLIAALQDGTATGQKIAREELAKMARLADERNRFATRLATAGPGGKAESVDAAINALWDVATAANEMWQALPDGDGKQEVRDTLAAAGFRVA